ncbi:hypothetical protein F4804DRAFT_341449 [Jackrogersella minutella]|nr:hypothetical protein F4804DRAFT_341449 [Jackrogersella minutella]
MPIINGQKMACEPCIRGHRSTKCAHGGDRVLVPVRKPGRPLSTCPHPPGKGCQCRNVTAALPKGGTCRCGGSQSSKTNGTPTLVKAEPSDNPPLSPTKQASFRVQKSVQRPGRKQSSDTSALQRMDSNSLNFQNGAGEYLATAANGMASPGWANFVSPLQNGMIHTSGNGISDHSTISSGTLTPGTDSPYHTPTSSTGDSSSQEISLETVGSCCSQRIRPVPQVQSTMPYQGQGQLQPGTREPSSMMMYAPQMSMGNGSMVDHIPAQIAANQQSYPITSFTQPGLFSDHSSFGTPHFPLQQSQWEQLVASYLPQTEPNGCASNSYTTHVCDCGPECDCLGCLAHPYNETTTQYIREVMSFQENNPMNGKVDNGIPLPDLPMAVGETPPQQTQSPSETESPSTKDLNMSPSEFLFVDYGSGMCACGDDCACLNCIIHRDPLNGELRDKTPN